jgi:integrase
MKAGKEHRVLLSDAALAVLQQMHAIRHSDYVFPGARDRRPLAETSLLMLLRRMGHGDITAHGFRSTFVTGRLNAPPSRARWRRWRLRTLSPTLWRQPTDAVTCSRSAAS